MAGAGISGVKGEKFRVLVTGFEPFGGEDMNPSEVVAREVVKTLSGLPYVEPILAVLPVSFRRVKPLIEELVDRYKPDISVSLGQWEGITYITLERVAINIADARIPDNDDCQPIDEPIEPGGPPAYFTTFPIKAILKRLRKEGIPAAISNSAGTFLCNYVFYLLLHLSHTRGYPKKVGYMHIPLHPRQAAKKRIPGLVMPPSMSPDIAVKAVVLAIQATIERFNMVGDEKEPP